MAKYGLPLLVAVLMITAGIFAFNHSDGPKPSVTASATAPAPATVVEPAVEPASATLADDVAPHIAAAQAALAESSRFLHKATTNNKGGFVEKGWADLDQAQVHLSQMTQFLQANPEKISTGPDSIAAIIDQINTTEARNGRNAPNLHSSLQSLSVALKQLEGMPAADGARDQTLADIGQAVSDISSGIDVAGRGGARGRGAAATRPGPAPSPPAVPSDAVILTPPPPPTTPQGALTVGSLTGQVNSTDGTPLAHVTISYAPSDPSPQVAAASQIPAAITDASGNFTIDNLPAGDYNIYAKITQGQVQRGTNVQRNTVVAGQSNPLRQIMRLAIPAANGTPPGPGRG